MSTPHPDVEELADLAEGLLGPARASAVEAHVARCADCANLLGAVRDVPSLLADLPVPPLPAGVSARIDAALTAESEQRSGGSTAQAPQRAVGATVSSLPRARAQQTAQRPWWRSVAVAAASVAVVAGGAAVVAPRMAGPDTTTTTTQDSSAADASEMAEGDGARAADGPVAGAGAAGGRGRPERPAGGDGDGVAPPSAVSPRTLSRDARRLERLSDSAFEAARAQSLARAPLTAGISVGLRAGMPAS